MKEIFYMIFFLLSTCHYSQSHFSLRIKADQFNDKSIYLSQIYLIDSTNITLFKDNLKIKDKYGFTEGEILEYPNPIEISHYNSETNEVVSSIIFIDNLSKSYLMDIKSLNSKEIIFVENSIAQSEYNNIVKQMQSLNISILPFDKKSFSKKKEYIKDYISKNPKSFVALWMIIMDYRYIGYYDGILEQINLFNKQVKDAKIYKNLQKLLKKDQELVIGNYFPKISISDQNVYSYLGEKYTLIDFWFSFCTPCVKQIPSYRNIYNKYKSFGFEMISISIDRAKDINNWKKIVLENKMEWYQILDINGTETLKLNINSFPTSFLLDKEGKIIAKDFSPEDLSVFMVDKEKLDIIHK